MFCTLALTLTLTPLLLGIYRLDTICIRSVEFLFQQIHFLLGPGDQGTVRVMSRMTVRCKGGVPRRQRGCLLACVKEEWLWLGLRLPSRYPWRLARAQFCTPTLSVEVHCESPSPFALVPSPSPLEENIMDGKINTKPRKPTTHNDHRYRVCTLVFASCLRLPALKCKLHLRRRRKIRDNHEITVAINSFATYTCFSRTNQSTSRGSRIPCSCTDCNSNARRSEVWGSLRCWC